MPPMIMGVVELNFQQWVPWGAALGWQKEKLFRTWSVWAGKETVEDSRFKD